MPDHHASHTYSPNKCDLFSPMETVDSYVVDWVLAPANALMTSSIFGFVHLVCDLFMQTPASRP